MVQAKKIIGLWFLNYLRILAKIQLAKVKLVLALTGKKLTIVGITGSAGKTSTLLATDEILKHYYKTKTNYGGNSESGIPLNILGLSVDNFSLVNWLMIAVLAPLSLVINWATYEVFIVEMGIDEPDEPKNMGYLLKIVKPDISVLLGVNPVHSQQFDKTISVNTPDKDRLNQILTNIAKEKAKIVNRETAPKFAIINSDDSIIQSVLNLSSDTKTINIGRNKEAEVRAVGWQNTNDGVTAEYEIAKQHYTLDIPGVVLPANYQISFAAALAVAVACSIDAKEAVGHLSKYRPPVSRSSLMIGKLDSKIIDSSYNSSPGTVEETLGLLKAFSKPRVAVLGDMRELGMQSERAHWDLYQTTIGVIDTLISVGPETKKYFGDKAIKFDYWWEAAEYLEKNSHLLKSAVVLIKGSQNTLFLEELVATLLADPQDKVHLCRQTPYWQAVKAKFRSEKE